MPSEKCCKICDCIEEYTIALVCAEAMEHNAIVGRECRTIGKTVKGLVGEEEFEELIFDHPWLEYPVTEPIASLAFAMSVRGIKEKCNVDTAEIREMFLEGVQANEKSHFGTAQQKFIEVKSKLMEDIAKKLCEQE